jgi:hypothetical protein
LRYQTQLDGSKVGLRNCEVASIFY